MLQDNTISYKKIQDVKDDVDDYIDHNQEPDFDDNLYLFDDLELDKISASNCKLSLTVEVDGMLKLIYFPFLI